MAQIFLFVVVGVAIIALSYGLMKNLKGDNRISPEVRNRLKELDQASKAKNQPYGPINFGWKFQWIAVKAEFREEVIGFLGLKDTEVVNWAYGLAESKGNSTFITPPIKGWVLLTGWSIISSDDETSISKAEQLLNRLSTKFESACYFGNHETSNWYVWMRSNYGKIERSLVTLEGQILRNTGSATGVESELNFEDKASSMNYPTEELVFQMAEEWAINPMKLEDATFKTLNIEGLGTLGKLS